MISSDWRFIGNSSFWERHPNETYGKHYNGAVIVSIGDRNYCCGNADDYRSATALILDDLPETSMPNGTQLAPHVAIVRSAIDRTTQDLLKSA
ncbi:hypothetical protein [Paenochrobactrum glaciei]|uniref:Uncharacterized protein n=1 Tax=Paenochrobactrum glaciei TaxID=486407 RepID=A0ABP3RY89_9HYPH